MPGATIKDCLAVVGAPVKGLTACANLQEEWSFIKKSYFRKILACHPDKGGDPSVFRDVLAAFEVLRGVFDASAIASFGAESVLATADAYRGAKDDLRGMSTPSWEYYAEAAREVAATYKVEVARSARSRCRAQGSAKQCSSATPFIEMGALRVGFMLDTGGYGMWVHIACWRVPSKVWLGLPDPAKNRDFKKFEKALLRMNNVSLCGVKELKPAERKALVRYVMDKRRWTFGGAVEKVKKKSSGAGLETKASQAKMSTSVSSIVAAGPERKEFVVPVPGRGAPAGSFAGKNFVITGTFPEVGGGQGLNVGKDRVRKMIESFGGKVASSVSGKTDVLLVGKLPGSSKVAKARTMPKVSLVDLRDLKAGLERGCLAEPKGKPMMIKDFAKGFGKRQVGASRAAVPRLAGKRAKLTLRAKKPSARKAMKSRIDVSTRKRLGSTLRLVSKKARF